MASQILEIFGATGETLTISIAPYGSTAYTESAIVLTEVVGLPGTYRGTSTGGGSGFHYGIDSNGTRHHFALANVVDTYFGSLNPLTPNLLNTTGAIVLPTIPTDWITANGIAADAIGASELAASAVSEIQSGLATPTNITAATGIVLSGVTHTGAVIPTVSAVTGLTASNLDTTISSRASQATLDALDDYVDTEVSAIKAKTDNLPSDPADASDIASSFTTVNTKLDTIDDFLDTEVAAIKADTAAILLDTDSLDTTKLTTARANKLDEITAARMGALTDWVDGGRLDLILDIIAADTTTDIPALIAALPSAANVFTAVLTTALTESYAADGTPPTLAQAIMLIQQTLTEFAISGTTTTVKKLDGSTTALTLTLNSATAPTAVTRAS